MTVSEAVAARFSLEDESGAVPRLWSLDDGTSRAFVMADASRFW